MAMSAAGSVTGGSGYQNPYTGVGKAGGAGMSVGELAHDDAGTRRSPTIASGTGESNTEYLLKAKALYSCEFFVFWYPSGDRIGRS